MFCDSCGAQVQPEQRFCASCGKAFPSSPTAYPIPPAVVPENRVRRHIHILAILWIVYAGLKFLGGGFLYFFSHSVFPGFMAPQMPSEVHGFVGNILAMVSVFLLAKGVAAVITGIGLLQRAPWARILTLVLAFLSLLDIPFGTALGIYTIWVLLSRDADREYEALERGM